MLLDIYSTISQILDPYKSKGVVKNWLGTWLFVFCLDPEDTKIILNSPACQDKPRKIYDKLFEFGLVSINGEKYKMHRKAITPLFSLKSLKSFLPLINEAANEFMINFDSKLTKDFFDISHNTMDFAFYSTLRTFLAADDVDEAVRMEILSRINK